MGYHVSNNNFYQGYNTYNKNRALAAAATVVNDTSTTPSTDSENKLMDALSKTASEQNGSLILAGVAGFVARPWFKFQDKPPWTTIRYIASAAFLLWGLWGTSLNGGHVNLFGKQLV
jgi:hypothetical protein